MNLSGDQRFRKRIFDEFLQGAAQRARAVAAVDEGLSRIHFLASSFTEMVMDFCARLPFNCCTSNSTICNRSPSLSDWKRITSSSRFRNSGLKVFFTSFLTSSSTFSLTRSSRSLWKPSPCFFRRCRAPMFEVMMRMVFLKSTVLPRPSVN